MMDIQLLRKVVNGEMTDMELVGELLLGGVIVLNDFLEHHLKTHGDSVVALGDAVLQKHHECTTVFLTQFMEQLQKVADGLESPAALEALGSELRTLAKEELAFAEFNSQIESIILRDLSIDGPPN